jgi:hypothetical protein
MKLIDVESKATLEDFLTLKKNELLQFLRKCNKKTQCLVKASSELSIAAHFFIVI